MSPDCRDKCPRIRIAASGLGIVGSSTGLFPGMEQRAQQIAQRNYEKVIAESGECLGPDSTVEVVTKPSFGRFVRNLLNGGKPVVQDPDKSCSDVSLRTVYICGLNQPSLESKK